MILSSFALNQMSGCYLFLLIVVGVVHCRPDEADNFQPFESNSSHNEWESWGYVDVRPQAHMFYWLYKRIPIKDYAKFPLIIWLQGGPGASSCGFGNFELIGPRNVKLIPRNTTWIKQANVLFIDNPVGTGFSYVDDKKAFTTDVQQISNDLINLLKVFLTKFPEFNNTPLYIVGESYGGKMAADFSKTLYQKIKSGEIKCNLTGYAMGNAWISPIDSTMTWGPFLYWMSITDENGLASIQEAATSCKNAVDEGKWKEATRLWKIARSQTIIHSNNVNFYNILRFNTLSKGLNNGDFGNYNSLTFADFQKTTDPLSVLMNGPVRKKIKIIPKNVIWGGQSSDVFNYQEGDFMKPVVDVVDETLKNTSLKVIVYQGQLDLICDTKASMDWVQQFTWSGLESYNKSARKPLLDPITRQTEMFVKAYKNFKFYWVLRAGHMVPADAGEAAYKMLERILNNFD